MTAPRMLVAIPTHNRPDDVERCLRGLAAQTLEAGTFDVLVVDDGSTPPIDPARVTAILPRAEVLRLEGVGLNLGRNAALERCTGEVLAFLDDDAEPAPGWAAAILAAVDGGADALGGRTVLGLPGPAPDWLTAGNRRYLAEFDLGGDDQDLPGFLVPVGANCAVRAETARGVGGFAGGLDRLEDSLLSNGDTEFFHRVQRGGGRVVYVGAAEAIHHVPPDRLTLAFFRRRARAQGESDALMTGAGTGRAGRRMGRELLRAGRTPLIAVRALARGRSAVPALLWWDYCVGRLGSEFQAARSRGNRC